MFLRNIFCVVLALLLGGCAQLGYYAQAVHGEMTLLSQAKPIDEVLNDPGSSDRLKTRLTRFREIRAFAVTELGLPDNASYTSYADLKRRFVMWNVVATPELSLTAIKWCFPIAGCVAYRGYYREADASAFAADLHAQGYDVQVDGVPAYSTLGWFHDPILSTFIGYADPDLARMVFHELAHQVVYVAGDTQFNESFATAVEEAGVDRWMRQFGSEKQDVEFAAQKRHERDFLNLLLLYRQKLEANYGNNVDDQEKRRKKADIFEEMQAAYRSLRQDWGGYTGYDRWFAEPLNNARLASVAAYHDYVPAFMALLRQEQSFSKFYEAARALSRMDKDERRRQLLRLAASVPASRPAASGNKPAPFIGEEEPGG